MEVEGKSRECDSNWMNNLPDARKMQGILGIYRDDVVVRNDNKGLLGVITEVAGDYDSDISLSDDEDQSDDNHDGNGAGNNGNKDSVADACVSSVENSPTDEDIKNSGHRQLSADQVRVLWLGDSESAESFSDVTVVDRGFLPGDYVASASDPTGQIGIVMDVQISVDLLAEDGSVKRRVYTKELQRVREFCVGDFVVSGPWLGRVNDVLDNVTV